MNIFQNWQMIFNIVAINATLFAREWHVLFTRQIILIRSALLTDEHRDARARKPLVPYGVAGARILSAYNSIWTTAYIFRLPDLFRSEECKTKCGGNGRIESTSGLREHREESLWLYEMRLSWRVAQGWSRWGVV